MGYAYQWPELAFRIRYNSDFLRSLHYDIKEEDIRALFSCFGTIAKVDMSHDSVTGRSKGFAFVEFTDVQSAAAAQAMDGFELANRKVRSRRP